MNISNSALRKAGFRLSGLVLLSVAIGGGLVAAETFQQGGSTATIEQSGGHSASKSRVTRYKNRQTIITQDGSSTDITIQEGTGSLSSGSFWEDLTAGADQFDCSDCTASSTRRAFKQRMLERMNSPAYRD